MANENPWRLKEWFPQLDDKYLEKLRIFQIELIRTNITLSLVPKGTLDELDRLHFLDSMMAADIIFSDNPNCKEIWDLGSGNGFPGAVIAILKSDVTVYCIDSDERKVDFLKNLGLRTSAENLAVRKERIELLPTGAIQTCVVRGLTTVDKLLLSFIKPVAKGGVIYHMKGFDWQKELKDIPEATRSTWNTSLVKEYQLIPKVKKKGVSGETRAILKSIKL